MDIITNTILPGSAPGPGLPGERLGIPPRAKREAMAAEQRAASGGGGGMPVPPPPMGNPVGAGQYDQGRPPLPPPNMGGGGYGGDNGAGQGRMGYGGGPRRPLSPQRGELSFFDQPRVSFACSDTLSRAYSTWSWWTTWRRFEWWRRGRRIRIRKKVLK